jgi:alpha-N-arabinofuranosidase
VPGEETGLAVRQSEQDHVRLAVLTGPGGEVVVRAIHRRAGVEETLEEARPDVAVGGSLRLAVRVWDHDYALAVATGEAVETRVATADGRDLDSVATGGFLGLWLGIYGTSAGAASTTVVEVDSVEFHPA